MLNILSELSIGGFEIPDLGLGATLLVFVILIFIIFFRISYTVVPAHLAHVVVSSSGRRVYMSREESKSTYFYIPILQRRNILPLENIKIEIGDIALRDINVARFKCDIVCWVVINDPVMAAERIGEIYLGGDNVRAGFSQVEQDVKALIESVSRTATMKIELLDLMKDRKTFSETVEKEIDVSLKKWGLELVDLEILDFHDDKGYNVISNLEAKQAKLIEADSRQVIAVQERIAAIAESEAEKQTKTQQAENRKEFREQEINTEQEIALREQEKEVLVQQKMQEANIQMIEAERALEVGQANYKADAAVKQAEGEKQSAVLKAEGESEAIRLKAIANSQAVIVQGKASAESELVRGTAQADINRLRLTAEADGNKAKQLADAEGTKAKLLADADGNKAKLLAEAEGKEHLADSLKKYEKAALTLESLYAARDIEMTRYKSLAEALKAADVKIITSGEKEILGIPVGAETGGSILGLINSLQDSGLDLKNIADVLKSGKEDKGPE